MRTTKKIRRVHPKHTNKQSNSKVDAARLGIKPSHRACESFQQLMMRFACVSLAVMAVLVSVAANSVPGDLRFSLSSRFLHANVSNTFKPNSFNFRGDNLRLFRFVCHSSSATTTTTSFVF